MNKLPEQMINCFVTFDASFVRFVEMVVFVLIPLE